MRIYENHELRMSLDRAASRLGVSRPTVWRWALHGVGGVKLRTFKLGGRRFTTDRDIDEFVNRLSEDDPAPAEVSSDENTLADSVERELGDEGLWPADEAV